MTLLANRWRRRLRLDFTSAASVGRTSAAYSAFRARQSGDVLHLVRKVTSGRGGRERFAVLVIEHDGLFDDFAKLLEHRLFVGAVATAIDEAG